jgi:hypothetical protein
VHKPVTLLLVFFLIGGVAMKVMRYANTSVTGDANQWQQSMAEKLVKSGLKNPQSINVTHSGDLQALRFDIPGCVATFEVTRMPNQDEWITLWEKIAWRKGSESFYMLNAQLHENYPVRQYWQLLLMQRLAWLLDSDVTTRPPEVYAVMYPTKCRPTYMRSVSL